MNSASTPNLSGHDQLVRKLLSIADLSDDEVSALRQLPMHVRTVPQNQDIVREGDQATASCMLIQGFLFRYKVLPHGARQIMSLHVPGDIPDLQSLYLQVMDHSLGALATSTVAMISHNALHDLVQRFPVIAAALWRDTLIDASIFREWLSNVGQRSAYQRAAHLLCEFFVKMRSVGLASGDWCAFPLTQQELGDAMGLSLVHVNRTLQQLRTDGLIVLSAKRLSIPNWAALAQAGEFDPAYLHLRQGTADAGAVSAQPSGLAS